MLINDDSEASSAGFCHYAIENRQGSRMYPILVVHVLESPEGHPNKVEATFANYLEMPVLKVPRARTIPNRIIAQNVHSTVQLGRSDERRI
jgi:hypothetical protein